MHHFKQASYGIYENSYLCQAHDVSTLTNTFIGCLCMGITAAFVCKYYIDSAFTVVADKLARARKGRRRAATATAAVAVGKRAVPVTGRVARPTVRDELRDNPEVVKPRVKNLVRRIRSTNEVPVEPGSVMFANRYSRPYSLKAGKYVQHCGANVPHYRDSDYRKFPRLSNSQSNLRDEVIILDRHRRQQRQLLKLERNLEQLQQQQQEQEQRQQQQQQPPPQQQQTPRSEQITDANVLNLTSDVIDKIFNLGKSLKDLTKVRDTSKENKSMHSLSTNQ